MSTLVPFNSVQIVSPDPTGTGGSAINGNFKVLSPTYTGSDPTSTSDGAHGYGVGSRWVNSSTKAEFVCTDTTNSSAVWINICGGVLSGTPSSGSLTTNAALGNFLNASSSTTFLLSNPTFSPSLPSKRFTWRIKNTGGSDWTLTLDTVFRLGTDITVTPTVSGKTDYIGTIYNADDLKWDVVAISKGYS